MWSSWRRSGSHQRRFRTNAAARRPIETVPPLSIFRGVGDGPKLPETGPRRQYLFVAARHGPLATLIDIL